MKPLPPVLEGEVISPPRDVARFLARHIMLPGHEVASVRIRRHETIASLLDRSGWKFNLPTICVVNGQPIRREDWRRRRIKASDQVAFLSKPWGGSGSGHGVSGKQILGLVAIIALAALAPWAAQVAWYGLGLTGLAPAWVSAGLIFGGALLINSLIAPKPGGQTDQAQQQDPIYSISAGGNSGKPLQPVPVGYGRLKTFPDYATQPWSEYIGNDQYLNVLLCIGCGKYHKHQLFIDDTVLWDESTGLNTAFEGVSYQFLDPGDTVTLFPANVTSSVEVSGQELPDPAIDPNSGWIGGFIANASGSVATALALDFVLPSGIYKNSEQGFLKTNVQIVAEARPVDSSGAPTGSFVEIVNDNYVDAAHIPVRLTYKVDVTPGRYEVRVRRTNSPISNGVDSIVWAGLRSFLQGNSSFSDVSIVALRIKANAQLSAGSSKKFGVLWTRILPVWNGSAWVETTTQNPYWSFYDAATNSVYGANRPSAKIDFQNVVDGATAADARADTFNFSFTNFNTIPNSFDTILKATRARHRWSGDVLTTVRDEWHAVPDMLLTDREIVRGSLSVDWIFNTEDSADSVILEYLEETTWLPAEVQYPPDSGSFTATNPARTRLDGVTNRDHAYREAAFQYLQAQLRRTNVTLDTEHDGRRLAFGSAVRVQSELPQTWGASGVVTNRSSLNLTLSPAPGWSEVGQHYIGVRDKRGRLLGPVKCSRGADDSIALLDGADLSLAETAAGQTLDQALARTSGADEPSFAFGIGTTWTKPCIVVSGKPNGDKVTVSLFIDDQNVHTTSLGSTPSIPPSPPLIDPRVPQIVGLYANFKQGVSEPFLNASWIPAAGAIAYIAQTSFDAGASWTTIYQGEEAHFSAPISLADVTVRVCAIGEKTRGAWVSTTVTAPTIDIGSGILADDVNAKLDAALEAVKALNPNVGSGIGSLTGLAANFIQDALDRLAQSITDLQTSHFLTLQAFRGSGVDVDTDNNKVTIWALDSYKDSQAQVVLTLQSNIDAEGAARTAADLTLTSSVNANTAAITSEATTRANADSALSARSDALEATVNGASATITVTIASPAVVTWNSHGLVAGRRVKFTTTGALPTGITAGAYYYVLSTGLTVNTFRISATIEGAAVNTSGSQSGVHTGAVEEITASLANITLTQASGDGSLATSITTLQAQSDNISAGQTLKAVASAGTSGASSIVDWQLTASVGGTFATAGLQMAALVDSDGNAFSRLRVTATSFEVQIPSVTGGNPIAPFSIQSVNGVNSIALKSDAIPDKGVPLRALADGVLGRYTYSSASTQNHTFNDWYNSGSGQSLAAATIVIGTGSSLRVYFETAGRPTTVVNSASDNVFGGTMNLVVDGVTKKTWLFGLGYTTSTSGGGVNQYSYGQQFSKEFIVTGLSAGSHTVQVVFIATNGSGVTWPYQFENPYIIAQELPGAIVSDGSVSVTPAVSYLSTQSSTSITTSATYSGLNIGTADAYRNVVLGFTFRCNSASAALSVTVGGISATQIKADIYNEYHTALFAARVPTGTTADIIVMATESIDDVQMSAWRVVSFGATPVTLRNNAIYKSSNPSGVGGSFTVQSGQVLTMISLGDTLNASNLTGSWGGTSTITEDNDAVTTVDAIRSAAYHMTLSETGTQTVSINNGASFGMLMMIAALWQ